MDENEERRLLHTALQNEVVHHDLEKVFDVFQTDEEMQENFGCTYEEAKAFLKPLIIKILIHAEELEHTMDILINGYAKEMLKEAPSE